MGCRLALCARKADELAHAKATLEAKGYEVMTIPCDLGQAQNIPPLVDHVISQFGTIDILVNNAGATWGAPVESHPDEAWRKVMSLNVDAPFYLSREIGRRVMIPNGRGRIINIASIAGLRGSPPGMNTIGYNTSKAALINFTRALASEWGQYNINVNAICPGFFPSRMANTLIERMAGELMARTPLRRIGGDEDLKGAVVFLASDAARHITGQALAVDGGTSAV
jgi:gluconate 5-dehydrogenase